MSNRIEVPALDPRRHSCWVGYDPAHDSYFVYVSNPFAGDDAGGEGDGHAILWAGTSHQEMDSVEEVALQLAPYAELPEEHYQTLRNLRLSKRRPAVHNSQSSMAYLKSK